MGKITTMVRTDPADYQAQSEQVKRKVRIRQPPGN